MLAPRSFRWEILELYVHVTDLTELKIIKLLFFIRKPIVNSMLCSVWQFIIFQFI